MHCCTEIYSSSALLHRSLQSQCTYAQKLTLLKIGWLYRMPEETCMPQACLKGAACLKLACMHHRYRPEHVESTLVPGAGLFMVFRQAISSPGWHLLQAQCTTSAWWLSVHALLHPLLAYASTLGLLWAR